MNSMLIILISSIVCCCSLETHESSGKGQRVDVVLSGRDIPSEDWWSEADPYVKVYYQFDAGSPYIYYGQTTASQDNPNPDWPQSFSFDFSGGNGNTQKVKFECWDEDLIWDDHIGDVEITLTDLVAEASTSDDGKVYRVLQPINKGTIIMKTRLGIPTAAIDNVAASVNGAEGFAGLHLPIAKFLSGNIQTLVVQ